MKRNYRLFLKDIIQVMEAIEKFFEGTKFEKPAEDDKTSSAVIKQFRDTWRISKKYFCSPSSLVLFFIDLA